jgi:PKD repeat protein
LGTNGIQVSNGNSTRYDAKVINTGNNSAVVAYDEGGKLCAQRIDALGNKQWGNAGIQLTSTMTGITYNNFFLQFTSSKNIVAAWEDIRASASSIDIYAQKLDTNGVLKWPAAGVVVDNSAFQTINPEMIRDNHDGVYITYGYSKGFVQHIDSSGQMLWGINGQPVGGLTADYNHHIGSDGKNGIIVSWEEQRAGSFERIYAQRFDSSGTQRWRPNGAPVATTGNGGVSSIPNLLSLNNGFAIAIWEDYRNGNSNQDIFAARLGNDAVLNMDFSAINTCFGDSTQFNDITTSSNSIINYWSWSYGDATTTGVVKSPKHKYANTGTYTVTLTNMDNVWNYQSLTKQVVISPIPLVNLGKDTTVCAGNTVLLNAGNPGLTYLWSTGTTSQTISAATTGFYWVQVTNGSCSSRDTIALTVSAPVIVNLGNDTALCTGNTLLLNAANTGGTYLWSTGAATQTITVPAAGTYWVQVTGSGGCIGRDTIVVTAKPLPVANFNYSSSNLAVNFTNTSANAITYNWLFGDGTNSTITSPLHTYSAAGTYPVKLVATNACKTDSVSQNIIITASTAAPDTCGIQFSVKLFPIPVHDILYIKFFTPVPANASVSIINSLGQRMRIYEFSGVKCKDIKPIDMRPLGGGVYFIVIKSGNIKIIKKLVKQ